MMNMEMNQGGRPNNNTNRPPLEWKEAARFEDGTLTVVVNKAEAGRYPRYSITVGNARDEKVLPFIPVRTEGSVNVKVEPVAFRLAQLLEQADLFISNDVAQANEKRLEDQINRDTKAANYGKPTTRVTGKTARNKAKKAGNKL